MVILLEKSKYLKDNVKLMKEYNYEKNKDVKPTDVLCGSNKKVWWKCRNGHEWESTVNNRARGRGCPICAGKKVKNY